MNCDDFRNDIVLLLSDELDGGNKERLEAHLASCVRCARFAGEVRCALHAVRAGGAAVRTVDLWPAVQARLETRRTFTWPRWALAPVFGALLVAGAMVKVHVFPPEQLTDAEIVKELEFVADYELWEDLETLEKADFSVAAQEA